MYEVDHRLGFFETLAEAITDPRQPDKIRHTANELIREQIFAITLECGLGDEDQEDLDRLAHDPAMRMATTIMMGLTISTD